MPRRNRRKPLELRSLPKDGSTFLGSQTVEGPSWTHGEPYVMRHIGSARAQKYLQTVEKTSTDARASDPSPAATSSSAENQPPKPMYPPSALSESLRRRMAHFESAK